MKNKKGFTLTEILVTLLILGVILAIAVPTFGKVLEKFKTDYYENQEQTLLVAGKEYFNDNKTQMPSDYLFSKVIELRALNGKYLDKDLTKYRSKDSCSKESYVVIIKDIDKYIYQECLICGDYITDTSGTPTDYCNAAWKNNKNITTEYGEKNNIYLYTGNYTAKDLRENLKIDARTISKFNPNNVEKSLFSITVPTEDVYYPVNIDKINLNTNKEGTTQVSYKFPGETDPTNINVVVYKHSAPTVSNSSGSVISLLNDNNTIDLSPNKTKNTFDLPYPSTFKSYQVKENGGGSWWNITCQKNCSYKPPSTDINTVQFRAIGKGEDKDKNEIGNETVTYTIQRKYTVSCNASGGVCAPYSVNALKGSSTTFTITPNIGYTLTGATAIGCNLSNGVATVSNVQIQTNCNVTLPKQRFTITYNSNTYTTVTNMPSNVSAEYGSYVIISSGPKRNDGYTFKGWSTSSNGSVNYNPGDTYNATSNLTLYAIWQQSDSQAPSCTLTASGTQSLSGWYTSNVIISFASKTDDIGVTSYGITTSTTPTYNNSNSGTQSTDTTGTTWYGYVKDSSGKTGVCNVTIKRDTIDPSIPILEYQDGNGNIIHSDNTNAISPVTRRIKSTDTTSGIKRFEYTTNTSLCGTNGGSGTTETVYGPISSGTYVKIPDLTASNTACFRAVDNAGNIGTWTSIQSIKVGVPGPSVPELAYKDGNGTTISSSYSWVKGPVSRQIRSIDSTGINRFEYTTDTSLCGKNGGAGSTESTGAITSGKFTSIPSISSSNTACFRAVNNSGIFSDWTNTQYIRIDDVKPYIVVTPVIGSQACPSTIGTDTLFNGSNYFGNENCNDKFCNSKKGQSAYGIDYSADGTCYTGFGLTIVDLESGHSKLQYRFYNFDTSAYDSWISYTTSGNNVEVDDQIKEEVMSRLRTKNKVLFWVRIYDKTNNVSNEMRVRIYNNF